MANIVQELKQALGPGARQTKYKIMMSMPTGGGGKILNTFATTQSFPGITQGPIEAFIQGRKLVLPGDTQYDGTWSLNFYQTEDHQLRKDFLNWMVQMDDFHNNKHQGDLAQLMVDVVVQQLDHNENETARYMFKDMHPQNVGPVELSQESVNQIQRFDVTFAYTSWLPI